MQPVQSGYPGMVRIERGSAVVGSDDFYPEEAPVHRATVDAFWIDVHPVTNAQFARFVHETGYITVAERPLDPADYPGAPAGALRPGALVFRQPAGPVSLDDVRNWWAYVPGTCWSRPEGPGSALAGRADHPVVQVSFEDASSYAAWAGKDLPTEAEWEFAARGGLDGATYVWGDELRPGGRTMANTWEGEFPWQNLRPDGLVGTTQVGTFPANGYGLYDTAGNVWEWTADRWSDRHTPRESAPCCGGAVSPRGSAAGGEDPLAPGVRIPRNVTKGGSFLCSANYCVRYRPAARSPQMIDSASQHLGFRCVARLAPALPRIA